MRLPENLPSLLARFPTDWYSGDYKAMSEWTKGVK